MIAELKIGDYPSGTLRDRNLKFVATHAYPQLYHGYEGWKIRNQHLEMGIGEYARNLKQPLVII